MLRQLTPLASFLRRRTPGARGRLTYRMLQALVVEPTPRPVVVRERSPRR